MTQRLLSFGLLVVFSFLLVAWYTFWLATPINLATADLGRHLKNGELLVTQWGEAGRRLAEAGYGHAEAGQQLLHKNFYAYTAPDFPTVNHHWGSGILFHLMEQQFGFIGVHGLFIVISLLSFVFFFDVARRAGGLLAAAIIAVALMPLIASRAEVRPEAFSYLFLGVYLWLLWRWRAEELSWRWLWVLPAVMVVWANIHIYFIFGVFVVGVFVLDSLWRWWRREADHSAIQRLFVVTVVVGLATLVTPFGLQGVIYPFTILNNYGYEIVENQSIPFLENWGQDNPSFLVVKVIVGLLIVGFIGWGIWQRKTDVALLVLSLTFGALAWWAIRNFTVFGLMALPALALLLTQIPWQRLALDRPQRYGVAVLVVLLASAGTYFYYFDEIARQKQVLGVGLAPQVQAAANFMNEHNITGPYFNNYDLGGYLIYHIAPEEKVFVDNRPEAYPVSFFRDIYIPMQENNEVWQEQLSKHDFNAIVFYWHDLTPWAQTFLAARVQDTAWVPVFVDPYVLILVRDQEQNRELIEQFALPRQLFRVSVPSRQ